MIAGGRCPLLRSLVGPRRAIRSDGRFLLSLGVADPDGFACLVPCSVREILCLGCCGWARIVIRCRVLGLSRNRAAGKKHQDQAGRRFHDECSWHGFRSLWRYAVPRL